MLVFCLGSAHAAEDPPVVAPDAEAQILRDAEALAGQSPPAPPPQPTSASAFNPALTAFGDILTSVGVQDGAVLPGSGPWIRSLELDLRAAIDPFANAVAVLAVEQEPPLEVGPSEFGVAAEELYVDFVALPAGFSIQAGGFRQPFGITNRAHPHDYPWPDTPLPLLELFGEEGLNEVGGVVSWRVPNPWGTGFTLQAGANAGSRFDEAGETALPGVIGRAEVFDRVGKLDFGIGGSATALADPAGTAPSGGYVAGGDLMIRYRANAWRSVVLLAEALTDGEALGAYGALQIQPTRPLYLGARADWLDGAWQAGGYASFFTSEFLRLRAGARVDQDGLLVSDAQLTFVWGSHPVEPYWVNR